MSTTENRQYSVTWRTIPRPTISAEHPVTGEEVLANRTIVAAYFRREGDHGERYVFKRADGMQVFDVAVDLVETIELIEFENAEFIGCAEVSN